MNANELAVLLDNTKFSLCHKAATMLRQQQADKEQLEFALINSETAYEKQQAEIEALKVRLNPYQSITDTKIEPTVVSYTHPVELTDEEIAVIGDKCFGTMSYELWVQTNEFARAILRKASE